MFDKLGEVDSLGWCEECQNWYPLGEDGAVLCECDDSFSLDPTEELDFND